MLQRSEMSWRLQTLDRMRNLNIWAAFTQNTKYVLMSFKISTSVFSVLVLILILGVGVFFGLLLFGRGGDGKVQTSPQHGFGLLHRYFDLGGHHVDRTFTHVYYLRVMRSGNSWTELCRSHRMKLIYQRATLSLTPHMLMFCSNSFSPSKTKWMLSWRTKGKTDVKTPPHKSEFQTHLTSYLTVVLFAST